MHKEIKILCVLMVIISFCGAADALTNIEPNGDFDNPSNTTIKYGAGWLGDSTSKWNIFYTSSSTQHRAQIQDSNLIITTGNDGGINDISLGGVPSNDPTLVSWQTYGTEVNDSSTYTAFAFIRTNKTNAHYFNVRMAYANGTMLTALISPRNSDDHFQFMEYQFNVPADIKWVRVGFVTRSPNTECNCYAIGAYEGVSGQLNKQTQILSISPVTSILDDMQPTFTAQLYDIDADVGMINELELVITNSQYPNGTAFYYWYPSYTKNNIFLPQGEVTEYYLNVMDLWAGNTITETYSLYVPDVQYVDVINGDETIISNILNETFIIFVVYVGIMVFLQDKYQTANTLMLFGIIETLVLILLMMDIDNIESYGSNMQYLTYVLSNAYLMFLTFTGLRKDLL